MIKPPPLPQCDPVSIFDLTPYHCRAIVADHAGPYGTAMYCGATKQIGSSYCPHHHAIYFIPTRSGREGGMRFRDTTMAGTWK